MGREEGGEGVSERVRGMGEREGGEEWGRWGGRREGRRKEE